MKILNYRFWGVCQLVVLVSFLIGCEPVPRRNLSLEDKRADMEWLYSQFNENYAPLNYKEGLHGFNYQRMKEDYLQRAVDTKTNEEFYDLMFQFVASFKDAHTSMTLSPGTLPGRAKVAYLGFSGKRKGNALVVTEILPTIDPSDKKYPVQVGDLITKLDGKPLVDVVREDMVRYRDLGQNESNLTFHMNRIFNRISIVNGAPLKPDAVLTLEITPDDEKGEKNEKDKSQKN
ncbi:MAG: PDZ domain-containing protein, partial [Bdellovibrionia bacterium]